MSDLPIACLLWYICLPGSLHCLHFAFKTSHRVLFKSFPRRNFAIIPSLCPMGLKQGRLYHRQFRVSVRRGWAPSSSTCFRQGPNSISLNGGNSFFPAGNRPIEISTCLLVLHYTTCSAVHKQQVSLQYIVHKKCTICISGKKSYTGHSKTVEC